MMVGLARSLVPEILDRVSPAEPLAIRARQDLARINRVIGNAKILYDALKGFEPPHILCDIGGGDGRLLLTLSKWLAKDWPCVHAVIADRQDIVSNETKEGFAKLGWTCQTVHGDIFSSLPHIGADIVIANLFLHHFADPTLMQLMKLVQAKVFIACEPRRNRGALLASKLVFLLGCNAITRHDAVMSVQAGFAGRELSFLWPHTHWSIKEYWAFPFSHVFVAHAG